MDALHQARANEEQSQQLANLHGAEGTHSQRKETGKETQKEPDGNATRALPKEKDTSQGRMRFHKCCSTHHLLRDCPMRRPPEEAPGCTTPKNNNGASSNVVTNQSTTLDKEKQCEQLHQLWAEVEYQRIKGSLQVDTVTGSVGPLYYC